jgi:very-short-patch-repair endonuclease
MSVDSTGSRAGSNVGDYGPDEVISPQYQIGKYRVDFRLESNCSGRRILAVIECDGHDFHERTKEQAARDRKRDRDLQSEGYLVFRFTGSQIYRDPWGCVDEMYDAIGAVCCARDMEDDERETGGSDV